MSDPKISRRSTLKLLGAGLASLWLPACSSPRRKQGALVRTDIDAISPINRCLGNGAPQAFSGDNPDEAHSLLWDKQAYVAAHGGDPKSEETVPLVIVGGGLSGLFSAYLLQEYKPVILEQAARLGGNAKGESWNGIDYAIGAAYFMEPDKGSPLEWHLTNLGIDKISRRRTFEDPVVWNNNRYYRFWEGETDPPHADQFQHLRKYFKDTLENANGLVFPEIPARTSEQRALFKALDRVSFREHMERLAGGRLHPHIETALEHFCWSSFGASFGSVNAAAGLNFYAGEFGPVVVTPGGNAAVIEKLLEKLLKTVPARNVRANSLVYDINAGADGVVVSYRDARGVLRAITARAVIVACPKFIAAAIIRDLEKERRAAIAKLEYHAYLVANVLLRTPIKDDFYDLFTIGQGTIDSRNIMAASMKQKATDIVLGTFARRDPARSVLTLYRGLPFTGGHRAMLEPDAYARFRVEFEAQIYDSILGLVGATKEQVVDIRLARWGHPLPVAATGLFADGMLDAIQKPFRERVFFVEQDNWALPAFETSVQEALHWAPIISRIC